jgi:hypothetical protein
LGRDILQSSFINKIFLRRRNNAGEKKVLLVCKGRSGREETLYSVELEGNSHEGLDNGDSPAVTPRYHTKCFLSSGASLATLSRFPHPILDHPTN